VQKYQIRDSDKEKGHSKDVSKVLQILGQLDKSISQPSHGRPSGEITITEDLENLPQIGATKRLRSSKLSKVKKRRMDFKQKARQTKSNNNLLGRKTKTAMKTPISGGKLKGMKKMKLGRASKQVSFKLGKKPKFLQKGGLKKDKKTKSAQFFNKRKLLAEQKRKAFISLNTLVSSKKSLVVDPNYTHLEYACDECDMYPIIGKRYFLQANGS